MQPSLARQAYTKSGNEHLNVFPLVQGPKYEKVAEQIAKSKRNARTVDSTSSVTIREEDGKVKIHVDVEEASSVVKEVSNGRSTGANMLYKHYSFSACR
uniref:Uncharacterized protein n=1 Tax=Salix viminalis TaxID=40686 RepID=A0A6N2LK07_SALVM